MTKRKLKKPHVNWYKVLMSSKDAELIDAYYTKRCLTRFRISENRCAYYVLKSHYSTTKLNRVRWLGEAL